jgi:hypothetical protein
MSFQVNGAVVDDDSGRPLAGLRVRLYDKDLVLDDFLGEARTDAAGRFSLRFTEAQFRDLFEKRPDLYLHVYDASGRLCLESTENRVRFRAGQEEYFEVRIPRERLRES